MSKHRAGRSFPHQARELREIATTMKTFGLPTLSTTRAVERIRQIANEIESGEMIERPKDWEGG